MKKASKILFIVSGAMGIVVSVGWFVASVIMFLFASPVFSSLVKQMAENTKYSEASIDAIIVILQLTFLIVGIASLVMTGFAVTSSVFAFRATKPSPSKSTLIINIVLGALSGNDVAIAGAILGLIAQSRENSQVIDV